MKGLEYPNKLTRYRFYVNAVSIGMWAIALAIAVASAFNFGGGDHDTPLVAAFKVAIIALLIGFAGERISILAQGMYADEERRIDRKEIMDAIHSISRIDRVGSSDEDLSAIRNRIKLAKHVKNTFINVASAPKRHGSIEASITSSYEDFLSSDDSRSWRDIVSVNELFNFRHTRVFDPPREVKGQHTIAVLKHNLPIVNFIILRNDAIGLNEVYFGWLYDRNMTATPIYKSSDAELVRMFETHFDVMWSEKAADVWLVDYSKPPAQRGSARRFVVDKAGIWVTVAVRLREEVPRDYAAFEIKFDNVGASVCGCIVKSTDLADRRINHRDVTYTPNKIYLEYEERFGSETSRGFCVYNFERRDTRSVLKGYILEGKHDERVEIFGLKVDPEFVIDNKLDVANFDDVRRIVAHHQVQLDALTREERQYADNGVDQAPN